MGMHIAMRINHELKPVHLYEVTDGLFPKHGWVELLIEGQDQRRSLLGEESEMIEADRIDFIPSEFYNINNSQLI